MTSQVVNATDILSNNDNLSSHLVAKDDSLLYDLGNLTAFDYSSINKTTYKENPSKFLIDLSRDNVQLLVSRLFQLPLKAIDEGTLAMLPKCLTPIPREKPLPQEKAKTRWEAFAALKGIKKVKKSKMVFDEKSQDYIPRFGYNKNTKGEVSADWMMEGKENDQVGSDPFQKAKEEKDTKIQKQKNREQRNYDDTMKRRTGNLGKPTVFSKENRPQLKSDLNHTFDVAKVSTASLGKFDKQLQEESKAPKRGVKRQADLGTGDVKEETQKNMKMLDRIFNKESVLNVEKATSQHIKGEERKNYIKKRSESSKQGPSKKYKSSK